MRSNLLRGPAKKKTVKFQDVSDSDAEDSEPEIPPAGRRRTATKGSGAGKAGLGANPVRKPATTSTRGRKPSATKKSATQPLSPKKAKQVAKSLSAYASSDGEDDELNMMKDDTKDSVKLVVHSPAKHSLENTGLSSPVRRINFTPKKASSFVDENGEPKLPTPKHGSERIGLSSPVRKINFTPNRSHQPITDNGHLALPPGNSIEFSDSMFMSSPARRPPPSSPFQFSMRESSNRGESLFRDSVNPASAPDFTPGRTSPLKMSPKKGLLGASFSHSPINASTSVALARTPLFQSPAKRIGSPFKSSLFSTHIPDSQSNAMDNEGTPSKSLEIEQTNTPRSSPMERQLDLTDFENDTEMVEDVARDIFEIELSSDRKVETFSPTCENNSAGEGAQASNDNESIDHLPAEFDNEAEGASDVEEYEKKSLQSENEEPETICFDAMEEANMPTADYNGVELNGAAHEQPQFEYEEADTSCFDTMEEENMATEDFDHQELQSNFESNEDDAATQEQPQFEYDEADTICFDAMEDAQMAANDLHDQEASDFEESEYSKDEDQFEYQELETVCFDAMEDAYLANDDLQHQEEAQRTDSVMEDANHPEEGSAAVESETEEDEPPRFDIRSQPEASIAEPVETTEMQEFDAEAQPTEFDSPSRPSLEFTTTEEALGFSLENEAERQAEVIHRSESMEQATSDESEAENTESASPHDFNHVEIIPSPLQKKQAILSPLPSPTVAAPSPSILDRPDNTENDQGSTLDAKNANNVNIDSPLHEENSSTPRTLFESSASIPPSLFNTPSVLGQHRSPTDTTLGFTPLAQKFSRWEQNTPSQARSLRPRRRGVFSLVGPLERTTTESTTNSGGVSYPDLSKSPLLSTTSLFAEPPLQPEGDDSCMSPEHEKTPRTSSIYDEHQVIGSRGRSTEIFEDPDSGLDELEQTFATEVPEVQNLESHLIDDKENCGPALPPSTPMKAQVQPDELRTVHTVSKVPLKAEGEVSPIKLPRKRGLSLLSTSPTRSSPRVRKPTLMALNDSVPDLSPSRRSPRVSRSPTPKRRSVTARRSSGKAPVMAAPSATVATASPSKKPRRSSSTEQQALQGAVVHVDVHTTEGEDASGIFVELLQQMGARCVRSWSWNPRSSLSPDDNAEPSDFRVGITHVVYKDGGLRTLEKVKKAAGLVKCVGVGWVLE